MIGPAMFLTALRLRRLTARQTFWLIAPLSRTPLLPKAPIIPCECLKMNTFPFHSHENRRRYEAEGIVWTNCHAPGDSNPLTTKRPSLFLRR
jgi:hypothetical protein